MQMLVTKKLMYLFVKITNIIVTNVIFIAFLQGSPLFAIRQRRVSTENTEGTIFLVGPLDFEAQSMYHLTLLAVVSILYF